MFKSKVLVLFAVICSLVTISCRHHGAFEIKGFQPIANYGDTTKNINPLYLDYKGSISNGFIIPSVRQVAGGKFVFHFSIYNNTSDAQRYFYKIYYQDESYKFPETVVQGRKTIMDTLASENFYGSWEDAAFKFTDVVPNDGKFYAITDSFRIIGNPRNEERYVSSIIVPPAEDDITGQENVIKGDPNWFKSIKEKAAKEKRTVDTQLRLDAIWVLNQSAKKIKVNNRWQRNPRVGKYSFMLVVTTQQNMTGNSIPEYIQDVTKKSKDLYINPYYYFLYGPGKDLKNTVVLVSTDTLKVTAKPDLGSGIYANLRFDSTSSKRRDSGCFTSNCGNQSRFKSDAAFEQYFNEIFPGNTEDNIRVSADVTGNEYSVSDYIHDQYGPAKAVKIPFSVSDCPCKTIHSDSAKHLIQLTSPATPEGQWRKEDVGIRSRNGFTYGKYYFKVKLPSLLNKSKLWNGLTDAMWLIDQLNQPWNNRRFEKHGYIPKYNNDPPWIYQQENPYSEIDFEILKASHYWPHTSYHKDSKRIPEETPADSANIMVTYTNWDLACQDVKRFTNGVDSVEYQGKYYGIHRWDYFYKALTGKTPVNNDEIFSKPYYYFEIEWTPTEIIWRIGPEKNNMRVVGYVNDYVSSIPNNQMLITITQEYHFSAWWPGLPFMQERIPFPSKDILGFIYDIEIE